jgi:peptidoglycan/LPS O-acetylase OafA/YrhL
MMTTHASPHKHNRVIEIDIMRAIAILMVVLSHLIGYISSNLFGLREVWQSNLVYLIIFGVGMFFFISGAAINLGYRP